MNVNKLGWIFAAVLVGGIAGMGFRAPGEKTGTVDMERVFNESSFAKQQTDNLRTMGQNRQSVLEFLRTYQTIKPEDAQRFRDLTLKGSLSAPEKAELERIKTDAQANETKFRDLSTKSNPTKDDLAQIQTLNANKDKNAETFGAWQGEFQNEIQAKREGLNGEVLVKVKEAIKKVAGDQGFTLVFDQRTAPYSANDITDAALKAVNAGK